MADEHDMDLIGEFVRENSETAFAALVERHINLVYSVALRFTGNSADAQDISQAVFIILAQKAASLRHRTLLTGWLYETTRLTAFSAVRARTRRQAYEEKAAMESLNDAETASAWQQLAPELESAMERLSAHDRALILLRFYENKSATEAAAMLGIKEFAAHKRTSRALDKLQKVLVKRGLAISAVAITGALAANSVQAAPAGLAKAISVVAVTKGTAAGFSTLTIVKGGLKLMAWIKAKTAIVTGVALILAAGTATLAVKEIQHYRTYPWQGKEGQISWDQLKQPPQVTIVPSHFHEHAEGLGGPTGGMIGTGLTAQELIAASHGFYSSARADFRLKLPEGRYDFIANLPGGVEVNKHALQEEVRHLFKTEANKYATLDTAVWLLKVKATNAADLRPSTLTQYGGFGPVGKKFVGERAHMWNLKTSLENYANLPVLDETGLTNFYDFEVDFSMADVTSKNLVKINHAFDEIGLELVATNQPVRMLIVEKAIGEKQRTTLLGLSDPGAELNYDWYTGTNGLAYRDYTDANSGRADFTIGNTLTNKESQADWRSKLFPLGPATNGVQDITLTFAYKVLGELKPGDSIDVGLRFFDETGTTYLGGPAISIGANNQDTKMKEYKIATLIGHPPTSKEKSSKRRPTRMDIWVTCNVFHPWSSGEVRFDDFCVTTKPPPSFIQRHWTLSFTGAGMLLVLSAVVVLGFRRKRD